MADSVKKLTVSYGAFSCTLEGFDDPFPVMKMVVDYFQDLADRDPGFGAHPERPDADYLRKLAQRGTNHGVEIETQENGVILRQSADQPVEAAVAARAPNLSLVPRAEPAFAPAQTAFLSEPESIGGEQFFGRTNLADTSEAESGFDREEKALERLLSAARMRSGAVETLAPSNPMSRLRESVQDQLQEPVFDPEPEAAALPDAELVAEFSEPAAQDAPVSEEESPELVPMAGFGAPFGEPLVEAPAAVEPAADLAEAEIAALAEEVAVESEPAPAEDEVVSEDDLELASRFGHEESDHITEIAELVAAQADSVGEPADLAVTEPELAQEQPETAALPAETAAVDELPETAEAAAPLEMPEPETLLASDEVIDAISDEDLAHSEFEWPRDEEAAEAETVSLDPAPGAELEPDLAETEPAELDMLEAEQLRVEAEAETAEIAPDPLPVLEKLILGAALMVVPGNEDDDDDEPELLRGDSASEDAAASRQIIRSRPVAGDFAYDAEARNSDPDQEPAPDVHGGRAALSEDLDAPAEDDDNLSLDKFARKVGAASLPELLEASAAYVTIVSGQPRFSRASILNMVDELSDERSYTQEARIKSFGKLLRNGSILRVEDGKFAISHSAKFNYEVKISA